MRQRQLLGAWFLAMAAVLSGGLAAGPASSAAGGAQALPAAVDAEQALAERFAPVVALVHQDVECGPGEPYQPSDVDLVLGDQSVALRGPWDGDEVIKVGPTAEDLGDGPVRLLPGLPGQPARGGLRLRAVGRGRRRGRAAHDVRPRGDRGRSRGPAGLAVLVLLPVQRLHQQARGRLGDDPARLRRRRCDRGARPDPLEVGYSQHEGLEVAGWDDPKLQIVDGTHPVVHAAAGSHANYYDDALYLGTSGRAGVRLRRHPRPGRRRAPAVAVIPSDPEAAAAAYPWIGFPGAMGAARGGVLQRADRPEHQGELDPPDQLPGGEGPRRQLRGARRRPVRHLRHRLLLQRGLRRVGGRPQARRPSRRGCC